MKRPIVFVVLLLAWGVVFFRMSSQASAGGEMTPPRSPTVYYSRSIDNKVEVFPHKEIDGTRCMVAVRGQNGISIACDFEKR